jgi:hypothetical protein
VNRWGEVEPAVLKVKVAGLRDRKGLDHRWSKQAVVAQYDRFVCYVQYGFVVGSPMSFQTGKHRLVWSLLSSL